ncbi:ferrous iron transport protein B [Sphingomonas guangdongensis]|uniref:Ferrous iron transport protein B n=1 Tax=Sphingomonas guangdongensis TaxID=1141890 RepID=A0A285QEI4_9SPHN|nr:ferrous iron transporter B [Sphingomonas guangdongensis]SOB80256.1 ferrous iron transport protein B [Sphingomonas guangdongensis]
MTAIPLVALVGNPNAGKSALFNALTGARQKVGNYPGVTVERHSGRLALDDGRPIELVDLPGTYSLDPSSPDEEVTRDVVLGRQAGERRPDALVVVADATNLDNHLRFVLQLKGLGLPAVLALNMVDMAKRDGLAIDPAALARELGMPVVETVAVRRRGLDDLRAALTDALTTRSGVATTVDPDIRQFQREARRIAAAAIVAQPRGRAVTRSLDSVVLHPLAGPVILFTLLFVMFQAVFSWSEAPIGWIEGAQGWLAERAIATLPDGFLRSLLVEGVINGVGSVVVFLPQIIILFLFILVLEASGYMVRAAMLMDRLMAGLGLSGRAFIPLLSSFACAIPGIMATRSISDPRERLTTILVAPLMTCSARLPVYAVIIGAFIPARDLAPGIGLQGVVLFALYLAGILSAMLASVLIRRTVTRGVGGGFLMELPRYQWPSPRDVLIGLWQRAYVFLRRAGTIIMGVTVALWLLASYPVAPAGVKQSEYSVAGRIASGLEAVLRPIGFNHEMSLAVIPAMAAREVAVSALQTVYAIDAEDEEQGATELGGRLAGRWSLATALAFLAWFVFAPQCLSTIAVIRRETNGWRWPLFAVAYLFALAYLAAGATYWTAVAAGLG